MLPIPQLREVGRLAAVAQRELSGPRAAGAEAGRAHGPGRTTLPSVNKPHVSSCGKGDAIADSPLPFPAFPAGVKAWGLQNEPPACGPDRRGQTGGSRINGCRPGPCESLGPWRRPCNPADRSSPEARCSELPSAANFGSCHPLTGRWPQGTMQLPFCETEASFVVPIGAFLL